MEIRWRDFFLAISDYTEIIELCFRGKKQTWEYMQEIGNYKRSDKNWKALNTYRHQEIQKQK